MGRSDPGCRAGRALRGGAPGVGRVAGTSAVPDSCRVLSWIDPTPEGALLKIGGAVLIVAMAIAVWFQMNRRIRAYGGGLIGGVVVAVGIVLLILSLIPGLFAFEV